MWFVLTWQPDDGPEEAVFVQGGPELADVLDEAVATTDPGPVLRFAKATTDPGRHEPAPMLFRAARIRSWREATG